MGNPAPLPPSSGGPSADDIAIGRTDWRHRALCRDEDPELFFPIGTTGPAQRQADEARAVCARCTVRTDCLADSLDEPDGVWAGLDPSERDPLARAHSVYLGEVARLDETLRAAAARTVGAGELLRLASAALSAEGDAVAALALTIAAGAGSGEVQAAAHIAATTTTESAAALAELGVTHPSRLRRAGQQLLAAAVAITQPAPARGLAVAS